ncbi:MAG: S-methyl-5-thioribose-1-phosphate isomerase [Spirochaetia bacterium]
MLIQGKHYRSIRLNNKKTGVVILDQRYLPFEVRFEELNTYKETAKAIREMHLRGAPLIGAAAAFGVYLACLEFRNLAEERFNEALENAISELYAARPTAVNLKWALERQRAALKKAPAIKQKIDAALQTAREITDEDAEICRNIGEHGVDIIEEISKRKQGETVNILTHCNAGWLATVDYGTVTALIYEAVKRGINLHVWVDETRPRNQGRLTSWELTQNNVKNTVICDNTGGHLMQHGLVDVVIVGTDRTARNGDAANKIGTYLKALAAKDNTIPFYVALPSPTFDPALEKGVRNIPIEERSANEVLKINGKGKSGREDVLLFAESTQAANYAFDVTPARLITGFITEKGVFLPQELAEKLEAREE